MPRSDNCTPGILLNFSYHQNYYKEIGIDLLRQTNMSILQQINFTGNWKKMMVQQCFLLLKSSKSNSKFSVVSLIFTE